MKRKFLSPAGNGDKFVGLKELGGVVFTVWVPHPTGNGWKYYFETYTLKDAVKHKKECISRFGGFCVVQEKSSMKIIEEVTG